MYITVVYNENRYEIDIDETVQLSDLIEQLYISYCSDGNNNDHNLDNYVIESNNVVLLNYMSLKENGIKEHDIITIFHYD